MSEPKCKTRTKPDTLKQFLSFFFNLLEGFEDRLQVTMDKSY